MKIVTNNQPRLIIDAYQLTPKERSEFDYMNWDAIDNGTDSASFVRYHGRLYDIGEFTSNYGITANSGLPDHLSKWDGYMSDSFFSAIVIRLCDDNDYVVMGMVFS